MNYTNSPLATSKVDLTKNSNPRQNTQYNPSGAITKITIHHMAGKMTGKACAEMHAKKNSSSANYYIGYDGDICLGAEESRRAWTSGSRENDYVAITIEVSNDTLAPNWTVSEASYNALINLCVDICKRNNIEKINFTGDKSGNLTMHKWFAATACPGPYLEPKFSDIANKVNEKLNGVEEPVVQTPAPKTSTPAYTSKYPTVPFKVQVLIDNLNYRTMPNGTIKGQTKKGTFTITKLQDDWGFLKSGLGWIYLANPNYTKIENAIPANQAPAFKTYKVRITATVLNVRKGPDTTYACVGSLKKNTITTILEEKNGWGKIAENKWISLAWARKI